MKNAPPPLLYPLWKIFEQNACPELRKELGILLSSFGSRIGIDPAALAERLLVELDEQLIEHERLQLLVNSCVGNSQRIREISGQIESEIRRYNAEILQQKSPERPLLYLRERAFELITPLVTRVASEGSTDLLWRFISAWSGADTSPIRLLYVVPTHFKVTCYAFEGRGMHVPIGDVDRSLGNLVQTANRFFRTTVALRQSQDVPLLHTERIGEPDTSVEASSDYEKVVFAHYGFELLNDFLSKKTGPDAMRVVPWSRDPLQACMTKAIGFTQPLASSLHPPRPDRRMKKVLVWHSGTLWGFREAGWLKTVFQGHGIDVDVNSDDDAGGPSFRDLYESDQFDALWVVGHGESQHFTPHESAFGGLGSVEDWKSWRIPQGNRRLLVLNICDSSTAALLGGLGEAGLAASLASSSQAVIGHLWPVSSALSSMLSALLAVLLSSSSTLFGAYQTWLKLQIGGKAEVLSYLGKLEALDDLRSAAESSTDDWRRIFVWGSGVFHS